MASASQSVSPPSNDGERSKSSKKRVRNFTADERATHRVIEKQRREALNESFLDLARLVPALAPARRLSKSLIVQESTQYLQAQREMCLAAAAEIQALLEENREVIAEVNTWREQYGMPPRQARVAGDSLQRLLKVDQDVLGTFPGGFGDNAAGDEHVGENGRDGQQDGIQNDARIVLNVGPAHPHQALQEFPVPATTDPSLRPSSESWATTTFIGSQIPPELFNTFPDALSMDPHISDALPLSPYTQFNVHPNLYQDVNITSPDIALYHHHQNDQTDFGFLPRAQYTQNS